MLTPHLEATFASWLMAPLLASLDTQSFSPTPLLPHPIVNEHVIWSRDVDDLKKWLNLDQQLFQLLQFVS